MLGATAGSSVGSVSASTAPSGADGLDWKFSQVFGERTPGEEVQEGV